MLFLDGPLAQVPALRKLLANIDPQVPLSGPRTMEQIMANNTISYKAVAVCLALSSILSSMLFGVKPTDIPTFISVAVILGIAASIACALPACRAARIDPMEALRYE